MARIVLIDDDPFVLEALGALLEQAGHDIQAYDDARLALREAGWADSDVLVTDIIMPNIDGLELCKMVRERHPGIHIIAVTGRDKVGGGSYLKAASIHGADRVLSKGDAPEEIVDVIAELTGG